MELDLGAHRRVRELRLLPIHEVREQRTGDELSRAAARNAVGARTCEQDRRFAATVGTGQNADGIVEGHPQILDTAQVPDANLRQRVIAVAVARAQRLPDILQFPRSTT